jgi:hypothetical protein
LLLYFPLFTYLCAFYFFLLLVIRDFFLEAFDKSFLHLNFLRNLPDNPFPTCFYLDLFCVIDLIAIRVASSFDLFHFCKYLHPHIFNLSFNFLTIHRTLFSLFSHLLFLCLLKEFVIFCIQLLTFSQNMIISSTKSLIKHFLAFKESDLAVLLNEFTSFFSFRSKSFLIPTFSFLFKLSILGAFFLEIFSIQTVFFLPLPIYTVFVMLFDSL